MKSSAIGMPWWLSITVGLLVIVAGILLLANQAVGNEVLIFLVGLGVFILGAFNLVKAVQHKENNSLFIPYLTHGLLDIVLLLLIITIPNTSALLGVIIGCWLIVFGFFEVLHGRSASNNQRVRIGWLLLLSGIGLILIPFVISIAHVIFLGIIALVFGLIKTAQGIISKIGSGKSTGGRSLL